MGKSKEKRKELENRIKKLEGKMITIADCFEIVINNLKILQSNGEK